MKHYRLRIGLFLIAAQISISAPAAAQKLGVKVPENGKGSPLAKVFAGNDGGAYYVSEVGKFVYWFAEHPGRNYAHVFAGTRKGNAINGKYWSVPKGRKTSQGIVKLKVKGNGAMSVTSQTGGFPSKSFSITTIGAIKNKLPGKRSPGFTQTRIQDLDGVFDLGRFRFYVRQGSRMGKSEDRLVFFVEPSFAKGKQPDAAFVFVGSRRGNRFSGRLIPVPKGKLPAPKMVRRRALFKGEVNPNRTLKVVKDFRVLGKPVFGNNPLRPVLPEIRLPIRHAMKILSLFEDRLKIHLDGYDRNGKGLRNGSYIEMFGKRSHFTIPRHTVKPKRWTYLNDVTSENVDFDVIGDNLARCSAFFERYDRELKRFCGSCAGRSQDGRGKDNQMKDWNLEDIRIDVFLRLINYGDGISYHVTDFKWHAQIVDTPHIDAVENWLSRKVRDSVQANAMNVLNSSANKRTVRDAINQGLRKLPQYLEEYNPSPYSVSGLVPTRVSIRGNDIVFSFD